MDQFVDSARMINGFLPHGYCMTWSPQLLWLHTGSDMLMTLSYLTYPIAISYFVWKRKDMPYRWLWLGFFIAFIVTCASTHFMNIVIIWLPEYWLQGWLKLISSLVSAATAVAIWWVIPRALKLPTPTQLQKARDDAEASNQAKSAFLANMSHELRTPLNAILGFSNMIKLDAKFPDSQRRNLEIINRSGEHLLSLINDVLDMAKIDAGHVVLEESSFDLGGMITDVTDMMSVRAREKNLQLLVDQSAKFPRFIFGDEARLRQILINLLGNALKFTREGGVTLRLKTRQNTTAHLVIEIEDTGCGIAPENQQRIFDPFVQLGEQGDIRGTGLGLTITRQFVELIGGAISVQSTPGKGSLFSIDLPLKQASAEEVVKPKDQLHGEVTGIAPGQANFRVLIVEDQLENQLLLSQLMEKVGLQVKVVNNGKQGVEMFQSWHPDLIWMDRRMPVMDGMTATRAIRQLPGGDKVKIIAVTASAFIEQRDEMLQAGMDDFMRKPYRASELYECLTKNLGVRFIYSGEIKVAAAPVELTSEMLTLLPPALRDELKMALESLENERIALAIQQIADYDPSLQSVLTQLVENYNYPAILKILNQ